MTLESEATDLYKRLLKTAMYAPNRSGKPLEEVLDEVSRDVVGRVVDALKLEKEIIIKRMADAAIDG